MRSPRSVRRWDRRVQPKPRRVRSGTTLPSRSGGISRTRQTALRTAPVKSTYGSSRKNWSIGIVKWIDGCSKNRSGEQQEERNQLSRRHKGRRDAILRVMSMHSSGRQFKRQPFIAGRYLVTGLQFIDRHSKHAVQKIIIVGGIMMERRKVIDIA